MKLDLKEEVLSRGGGGIVHVFLEKFTHDPSTNPRVRKKVRIVMSCGALVNM